MKDQANTDNQKKVWKSPDVSLLSRGCVTSGANPAHNEASFTFISSNPAHTRKYGNVGNAPKAATFTYSHLQIS